MAGGGPRRQPAAGDLGGCPRLSQRDLRRADAHDDRPLHRLVARVITDGRGPAVAGPGGAAGEPAGPGAQAALDLGRVLVTMEGLGGGNQGPGRVAAAGPARPLQVAPLGLGLGCPGHTQRASSPAAYCTGRVTARPLRRPRTVSPSSQLSTAPARGGPQHPQQQPVHHRLAPSHHGLHGSSIPLGSGPDQGRRSRRSWDWDQYGPDATPRGRSSIRVGLDRRPAGVPIRDPPGSASR